MNLKLPLPWAHTSHDSTFDLSGYSSSIGGKDSLPFWKRLTLKWISLGVVPQITSQLATSLESKSNHKHITPKRMTSQPCNGKSFVQTQKKFGHRNGRSSCAHSIGKFFPGYIVLFSFETSATGSPGNYLYPCIIDLPTFTLKIYNSTKYKVQ